MHLSNHYVAASLTTPRMIIGARNLSSVCPWKPDTFHRQIHIQKAIVYKRVQKFEYRDDITVPVYTSPCLSLPARLCVQGISEDFQLICLNLLNILPKLLKGDWQRMETTGCVKLQFQNVRATSTFFTFHLVLRSLVC